MPSRRIPAAVHPLNHALVQELCLVAALTRECREHHTSLAAISSRFTYSSFAAAKSSSAASFYRAAQSIARCGVSMEETTAFPRGREVAKVWKDVAPAAERLIRWRLGEQHARHRKALLGGEGRDRAKQATRDVQADHQSNEENADAETTTTPVPTSPFGWLLAGIPHTRYIPPGRLLALFGPGFLMPPTAIPKYLQDDVTYEEALRHAALLESQLAPHGLRVALVGACRRGAPLAHMVELAVSLTPERVSDMSQAMGAARREAPQWVQHGAAAAEGGDVEDHYDHLRAANPSAQEALMRVCERALDRLQQCGYIVAGRSLKLSGKDVPSQRSGATSLQFVTRLWSDEVYKERRMRAAAIEEQEEEEVAQTYLVSPPPLQVTDPATLLGIRLHTVVLHFTSATAFHIQRFLRTGPVSFTTLVTMAALKKGVELYDNGLFSSPQRGGGEPLPCDAALLNEVEGEGESDNGAGNPEKMEAATRRGRRMRCELRVESETDIFTHAGLPYVHPCNRGILLQLTRR